MVAVAVAVTALPASQLRWAITLFHTRPTHSGNGGERPPSAQAPGERARSPALSPAPAQTRRALTAQAPKTDNEKGSCGGSHPQAFPAAYCASVPQRPAGTMERTPAEAGTAANQDYSSQRAARQLQAEVALPGMLGCVVSAALQNLGSLEDLERLSLEDLLGRFDKCHG